MQKRLFQTPLILLQLTLEIGSKSVILFKDNEFKGPNVTIDVSSCESPLPKNFYKKVSSINTLDQCVNLYKNEGCSGDFLLMKPGVPGHNALSLWGDFNDQVKSIGPCDDDPCSPGNIQAISSNLSTTTITVYDHSGYGGAHATLVVNGCVNIPRNLKRRVSSVKVLDDAKVCIEFHKNWDCTGPSTELRHASAYLISNFVFWGTLNDNTDAVSLCGFNCNRSIIGSSTVRNSVSVSRYTVTVFDELDRNGNSKSYRLLEGCNDITGEWDGESKSIDTYGECVLVYSLYGCPKSAEYPSLTFNASENSQNNISWTNFPKSWSIRSLKPCKDIELAQFNKPVDEPDEPSVPESKTNWSQILIFIGVSFVLIVLGAVVSGIVVYRLRDRRVVEGLSLKEIEEFRSGIGNTDSDGRYETEMNHSRPYDQKFEISKNHLTIDTGCPLGSGAFAIVYKGKVKRPETDVPEGFDVAVKMVKPYTSVEYTRALLKEIKTMIYVGSHKRIVTLIGCCTEDLINGQLKIITELCENGSLEKFLRGHPDSFVDLLEDGDLSLNKLEYMIFKDKRNYGAIKRRRSSTFNTIHLMQWSLGIAEGMDYLAYKKVIHGDLAARNILLDSEFNVKISDFGLSRQMYQYSQYIKKNDSPLPWRWLAVETLQTFTFSTESDVWAFGVTVWEIFSLGKVPFPDRIWNDDFLVGLSDGLRLTKPKYATSEWFAIISKCWIEKPSDRITFRDVRIKLAEILRKYVPSDPNADLYLEFNELQNTQIN